MATWANTTFATLADLAKIENEILTMRGSGSDDYTATAVNIGDAEDPITALVSSVDVSNSKGCEVVGVVSKEATIAVGKSLTIKIYDSADDITFSEINTGSVVYERLAEEIEGEVTIAVGTELFRWVIPTTCENYIKAMISSDATNTGSIDIYVNSVYDNKMEVAKQFMGEDIERYLLNDGYGDDLDYSGGDELKDVITNLSIFKYPYIYLTLHLIYEDFVQTASEDDEFKFKSERYLRRYKDRFDAVYSLKNISRDADGTTDDYKEDSNSAPRIMR